MVDEDKKEIDLTKVVGIFRKNIFFSVFSVFTFLVLIITIFSLLNVNLGENIINKGLHLFPSSIFLLLLGMFILSTLSAYYKKYSWMFLPLLFWIIFTSSYIRTSNLEGLKDVTTGEYTLGPDLDPFLYLRHAQEILDGNLENPDMMRYVPLGSENYASGNLMPWAIIVVFKIFGIFGSISLNYAAIISPVIFFALSTLGFFLFNRSIFSIKFSKNIATAIATLASTIYIFLPQMLHRTTGGIPEIESLGMVWFWFALFFFTIAWKNKEKKYWIIYGLLAGIFTGLMSWTWGGYRYLYMAISITSLILFLFEKEKEKNFSIFFSWIVSALILEILRLKSVLPLFFRISDTGISLFVLFILIVDLFVQKTKFKETVSKKLHLSGSLLSLGVGILSLIIILLIFAPSFLMNALSGLIEGLLYPFGRGRVGITVAENKVPYFSEVISNFGNLFWMFLVGSLVMFWDSLSHLNKNKKFILTGFFILFLAGLSFSRISSTSMFNGDNFVSSIFYLGSIFLFIISMGYTVYQAKKNNNEKTIEGLKKIEISDILILSLSFIALVSTRGAIRLFFIIAPLITIVVAYLPLRITKSVYERSKENKGKAILVVLLLISGFIIGAACINYAQITSAEARATVPGSYEQYWQKSMAWVRNNTSEGSVFIHWWDYGYWIQTLGERPTVTDGGHPISYWDHLIGRYVLTTPYPETALSFMKTHNVSYLLIDQTDLGKYSAYSSIGNDKDKNDRMSWIPIMVQDQRQTQETNVSTVLVYSGGTVLDGDVVYKEGDKEILLPEGKAGLAGVIIESKKNESKNQIAQPIGIFVYNQQQLRIPIRKIFIEGSLLDFGEGMNSTIVMLPSIESNPSGGLGINNMGSIIYLSEKVQNSLFAKLYLMSDPDEEYPTISLAYTEQDPLIANLKSQGAQMGDFVYYQGFRGPMKIWKVDYPQDILTREEFLSTDAEFGSFDDLEFTR